MTVKSLLLPLVSVLGLMNLVAADDPEGFAGIAWGSGREEAIQEMLKKPGVAQIRSDKPGRESFSGGAFADLPARVWGLEFTADGKLARGAVVLKPAKKRDETLMTVKQLLTRKYGPPSANSRKGDDARFVWHGSTNRQLTIELESNPGDGPKITYRNESVEIAKPGSKKDI
jgi:hypothetical protein